MTGLLVFAVIPADGAASVGFPQIDGLPPGLHVVEGAAFAAVVGAAPDGGLRGRDRSALLPWLLSSQKVIGHLLDRGAVLPVALGTVLENADRARHMLEAGAPMLRTAFAEIAGRCEMNLSVRWPLDVVVAEVLARFPSALRVAAGNSDARDEEARQTLAAALAEAMARERSRVSRMVVERLQATARDLILSAPLEPEGVLEVALLLDPRAGGELDRVLEALDQEFDGRLRFRLVGPLAPYSFASVQVHLASGAAVAEAGDALGVAPGEGTAALKTAYRHALRRVHPDLVSEGIGEAEVKPADTARLAALTAAYEILAAEHMPVSVRRQESVPLA